MKKFNWGHGIAIFLVIFILLNVAVVLYTFSQDVELVTDNYYEKELKYEDQLIRERRGMDLPDSLQFDLDGLNLVINYPPSLLKKSIAGNIHLYRPDQKKFDYNIKIEYNSDGQQVINMTGKAPGKWKISITLNDGSLDYLFKKDIYLR
ncbi:MAG: FixH family protein [Ignavibacteriales bacterium]|nr:FixH family protein [Ignavibacteriales bacterium]MBP9121763.1 FixH family protein [Ignavibacteriaceae bacterium]